MNSTLEEIAEKVEATVATAKAICVPEMNQIIVTFINRPGIEVALLSPWYQMSIKNKRLSTDDITDLIMSLEAIAQTQ